MKNDIVTDQDLRSAMESFARALAQSIGGADLKSIDQPTLIRAISERLEQEAQTSEGAASSALRVAATTLRKKVEQ